MPAVLLEGATQCWGNSLVAPAHPRTSQGLQDLRAPRELFRGHGDLKAQVARRVRAEPDAALVPADVVHLTVTPHPDLDRARAGDQSFVDTVARRDQHGELPSSPLGELERPDDGVSEGSWFVRHGPLPSAQSQNRGRKEMWVVAIRSVPAVGVIPVGLAASAAALAR